MRCYHCNSELTWGGDHDIQNSEEYKMVTNLSCPRCHSFAQVFQPKENKNERSVPSVNHKK